MPVLKIKSVHPESQGPFVLIEKSDFDKEKHELYVEEAVGSGSGEKLPPADNAEKTGQPVVTDPSAKPWAASSKKKQ